MLRRPILFALTLVAGGLTACERAATDPSLADAYAASLDRAAPANTLPALFNEALLTAQRRDGAKVLTELAREWEAQQSKVQAAYSARDMATVQAQLATLRSVETRVILEVFGSEIVHRVLRQTTQSLVGARTRIDEAAQNGVQTRAAEHAVREVNELVSRATALVASDASRALSIATDAAAQLATINDLLVGLRRLRGVDELFPEYASALPHEELRQHARLNAQAQAALRDGTRSAANEKLEALRAEEIRLVLLATDNRASEDLLTQVGRAVSELRIALDNMRARGQDVGRAQRMLNTATDMYNRSGAAEAAGDHATALDLASHASGLLNSLRHLTTK